MDNIVIFFRSFDKTRVVKPLTAVYFLFALVEIIAEMKRDRLLIPATKPFLMPLLIAMYYCSSKKLNTLFIFSLIASWLANLFFISDTANMMVLGFMFFMIYRLLIIYVVFRNAKFPGNLLLVVGCMPFLFLYLIVADMTFDGLGNALPLFVLQGLLMIIFGGLCLGNYILKPNRTNTFLLTSTMFIIAAQFLQVIRMYYISLPVLQPVTLLLFVIGQYLLYRYVLLEEKKRRRYRQITVK